MSKLPPVLVFGVQADDDIAGKLLMLGFRALRAGDEAEARDQLEGAGDDLLACLVDARADIDEVRALSKLAPRAELLAVGPRPAEARLKTLRDIGIRIGLFDPIEEGVLQFCLGQATLVGRAAEGRRHGRVPTDLTAIVRAKSGQRTAAIHEMSVSGAFLATLRPLMKGATVPIELRLPGRAIEVEATVVWSNVIGNLRRDRHPTGMAVKFGPLPDEDMDAIAHYLGVQLERYRI